MFIEFEKVSHYEEILRNSILSFVPYIQEYPIVYVYEDGTRRKFQTTTLRQLEF